MNNIAKKALTGIIFMLIFAVAIGTAFAQTPLVSTTGLQKKPYLIYPGVNTEMQVLWQDFDTETTNYVIWSTDPTFSTGMSNSGNLTEYNNGKTTVTGYNGHQYAYTITGLQTNTTYYYQVADATNGVYGTGSFITAPASNATSIRFLAQGDSRSQPYGLASLDAAMTAFYSQPGNGDYQRLSIANGDWVSSDGEQYWTQQWFTDLPGITAYTANVPLNGAKGNHDDAGGYSATFPKYYPYPYPTGAGALSPTGAYDGNGNAYYSNLFWSFDYGPVHFTVIDEYSPMGQGTAQYSFVQGDLAAAAANPNTLWKIVIYHEPAYSSGADGDNTAVRVYEPLYAQYGVDMTFSGHSHNYTRCEVYNSAQAGGDNIAIGVPHITSGGGGAPVYQTDYSNNNVLGAWPHVITAWPSFEFMTFDVEGKTLTMTAYQVNNITNLNDCPSVGSHGPYVPACSAYTFPAPSYTQIETVVLNHFTNVTPQVSYSATGVTYNRATKTYSTNLTITNNGPTDLVGNVDVVLDGILDLPNINTNVTTSAVSGLNPAQLSNMYTTPNKSVPGGGQPMSPIAKNPSTGPTSPAGSSLLTTVTLTNATGSSNGEPLIQVSTTGLPSGQSITTPLTFTTSAPPNGNPAFSGVSFNPIILQE